MNNLINQLRESIYRFDMQRYRIPTKIKITSDFYNYLAAQCAHKYICSRQEECSLICGIPFEIDNTIANHYELVYEEEN